MTDHLGGLEERTESDSSKVFGPSNWKDVVTAVKEDAEAPRGSVFVVGSRTLRDYLK